MLGRRWQHPEIYSISLVGTSQLKQNKRKHAINRPPGYLLAREFLYVEYY